MVKFGERLKECMDSKSISQTALADKLGTTQATVSRWISDKQQPDILTILRICFYLEEEPTYLLAYNYEEIKEYEENVNNKILLAQRKQQQEIADLSIEEFNKEIQKKFGYLHSEKRNANKKEISAMKKIAARYGEKAIKQMEIIEENINKQK